LVASTEYINYSVLEDLVRLYSDPSSLHFF